MLAAAPGATWTPSDFPLARDAGLTAADSDVVPSGTATLTMAADTATPEDSGCGCGPSGCC